LNCKVFPAITVDGLVGHNGVNNYKFLTLKFYKSILKHILVI